MKRNVLLLVASAVADEIALAAGKSHHDIRCVASTEDAFLEIADGMRGIDVVVIDLDPTDHGPNGIAVLEALGCCERTPPVIALTGLEESYMTPIVVNHGGAACLGKPLSPERLSQTIEDITRREWRPITPSSDLWGHPLHETRLEIRRRVLDCAA